MAVSKVIAVDLGGSNLRVALVQGKKVLKYTKEKTPKDKKTLLNLMVEMISKCNSKEIKAIGVGSPGPLKNGKILNTPNLPIKNFDLKKFLKKKFKKRVEIENDANCVALSEAKYGFKRKNFIILTLGTGIGGGIIINGKIYKGAGQGGELGHVILDKGRYLEDFWQESRRKYKKLYGKKLLMKDLLKSKDKPCKKMLEDIYDYFGKGFASLISVLDPEAIVLMGGARECGTKFIEGIKKSTYNYSFIKRKTPIMWTNIPHPGILGASLLVQ